MRAYPVRLTVAPSERFTRLQLVIRLLAFVVLGMLGLSLGALFIAAYLALPGFAAARLGAGRGARAYLEEDGPRVLRALGWFAAIYAWFGLATDRLPLRSPDESVRLEVEPAGQPTPASALLRILVGLPSALVLALLGCIACLVWLWAALQIVVRERVSSGPIAFLVGMQRWATRLLVYQASLVDEYPPFSFETTGGPSPAAETGSDASAGRADPASPGRWTAPGSWPPPAARGTPSSSRPR